MSDVMRNIDDYDQLSDMVRRFCSERLYEAERSLRPWINGSFGDINPGHMSAYVTILRELGRLYGAHKPPRRDEDTLTAVQVQKLLEDERARMTEALEAAVAETELRVRLELEAAATKSIESAKSTAIAKLTQLQKRAHG